MENLPVVFFIPMLGIKIMILVLLNKLLVLFNKSIRNSKNTYQMPLYKGIEPCYMLLKHVTYM